MNLERRVTKLEQTAGPTLDAEQERVVRAVAARRGLDPDALRARTMSFLTEGLPDEVADRLTAQAEAEAILARAWG
jgi:hypothetical protein